MKELLNKIETLRNTIDGEENVTLNVTKTDLDSMYVLIKTWIEYNKVLDEVIGLE